MIKMVDTTIECDCGYEIKINLPEKVFVRGPFIFPCPRCGKNIYSVKTGLPNYLNVNRLDS